MIMNLLWKNDTFTSSKRHSDAIWLKVKDVPPFTYTDPGLKGIRAFANQPNRTTDPKKNAHLYEWSINYFFSSLFT